MREEREDLKEAAEHSLNIIMDLDLAGKVRYVSPSWRDVVGTSPDDVKGKPVLDIIYAGKDGFAETIESVRKYDSRSHIARFSVLMGPHSILRRKRSKPAVDADQQSVPPSPTKDDDDDDNQTLNLEAQGIMVYDRATGAESHVRQHRLSLSHLQKDANRARQCGWSAHRCFARSQSIFPRSSSSLLAWVPKCSPTTSLDWQSKGHTTRETTPRRCLCYVESANAKSPRGGSRSTPSCVCRSIVPKWTCRWPKRPSQSTATPSSGS